MIVLFTIIALIFSSAQLHAEAVEFPELLNGTNNQQPLGKSQAESREERNQNNTEKLKEQLQQMESGASSNKGAINPRTGEFYPKSGMGVINPQTGEYYPKSGNKYINPSTGEVYPAK